MIRKLLPLVGGLFLSISARAEFVKESPIAFNRAGTAITVSVSTSAWTLGNTATSKMELRSAFRVTNPAANSYAVYSLCHSAAPAEAITVLINEVQPGENLTMPCGPGLNLYLLSLTAAQNIDVWEIGQ
jgi:hypothetical protein